MDALLIEILQMCLLLESKGKVTKISWHSGSLGTKGSILVEYWRDRRHYQLWMDDEQSNIDYFSKYVIYSAESTLGLQQIIAKLKEAAV